ncbi:MULTISPECIES: ATP-grasp domain-containing protein [Kitasatospora]|uniref:ATP-grasp domain-containing protein n=1 Tax=Kitasatospora setae (strain ATCC 33774 / DSM 43861 / JCM 3304 / KCC A-0304 / NBRC 14216 / KM-6054) TaxID=452652 RepID=E4N0F9_KITSK|nr:MULTISPECIES: ATP-grasp domain-containing protein [Kitasatospora]BAJ31643.1 hypothetical protein KSE_58730 [Kitasatospora setae KM-6054]
MHIVMLEVALTRGFGFVDDLVDAGAEVSVIVEDLRVYAGVPGFENRHRAARIIEVPSTRDVLDLAGSVRDRLGPNPVDGVVCVTEHCMPTAAALARDLGVPGESLETVLLMRDKAAVRARLDAAGLGTLRWRTAGSAAEGLAAAAGLGYPLVVKPNAGWASQGVTVAWRPEQVERALRAAFAPPAAAPAAFAPGPDQVLLEEFRFGRHISAELLVQDGRILFYGFSERLPSRPGTTAELGGHFPAEFEQRGAAREFVREVVEALGVRNSPMHIELLVTPTGPELLEVNGRIAGHAVTRQLELALGRSVTADLAALAAGRPVPEVDEPVAAVALRQLWSPYPGTVRAVALPAAAPEVAELRVGVAPGDRVRALDCNYDRYGHVLAVGGTVAEACAAADRAAAAVRVEIERDATADTADQASPDRTDGAPHLLLVLDPAAEGSAELAPERVLAALGGATGRLSVLWTGPAADAAPLRARWERRYAGEWLDAPDEAAAHRALAALRERRPVDAVLGCSPGAARLAELLEGCPALPGAPEPQAAPASAPGTAPGLRVVSYLDGGTVRHLGVYEELPAEPDGSRSLLWRAGPAAAELPAGLLERAEAAARRTGPARGLVRYPDGADRVLPGLDQDARALLDAVFPRPVLALAATAALGLGTVWPEPRPGSALVRVLAAPPGRFRVVAAPEPGPLRDEPAVASVDAPPAAGRVLDGAAVWLRYAVTGADAAACRAVAARVESFTALRHESLARTHVLLVDRSGGRAWTDEDGSAVLPADRYRVSVIGAPPVLAAPVDLAHQADPFDLSALDSAADAIHAVHPVDRVSAGSERLLGPVAELRSRYGAAGDDRDFTRSVRDKALMKRVARAAGIRHAPGGVLHEPALARELLARYGAVVLKPRELSGSQGVAVCRDEAALDRWLRERFTPGQQLAEAFVDAPMCHLDAVVHDGSLLWDVSVYRRDTLAFTRGLPLSSLAPDDPVLRAAAGRLVEQVVEAWRIRSGVLHVEAFVEPDGLTLCEVAARPGGGGIVPAFRATRGVDLRHAKVLIDAGDSPWRLRRDPVGAYAGWTVHYASDGRLAEFDDSAVAAAAVHRAVAGRVGELLPASDFSGTGLSTHVFAADSAARVDELVTLAESAVRIRIEPVGATAGATADGAADATAGGAATVPVPEPAGVAR